jgi:hypothetical protein
VTPSASRVASRFLAAKEWGDPSAMISQYRAALTAFQGSVTKLQSSVAETFSRYNVAPNRDAAKQIAKATRGTLSLTLVPLVKAARPLAEWIIQTRVIPPRKTKSVELAARAVGSMARVPQDIPAWYEKNNARLNLLLEAASWPERSASGSGDAASQITTVGPFKVHNTIGADAKHFKDIRGLIENAARSIATTRDFKKVLYGDVFIVGQLKQSNTLAWYNYRDDDVYVRSLAKKGFDDLQSLVHELGHRYWFKFATPDQKKAITTLFYRTGVSAAQVGSALDRLLHTPNPGDKLPFRVRGVKGDPIVDRVENELVYLVGGGRLLARDVSKILGVQLAFPTTYASKNVEEFFAECFAFFVHGRLKPDLADAFRKALD